MQYQIRSSFSVMVALIVVLVFTIGCSDKSKSKLPLASASIGTLPEGLQEKYSAMQDMVQSGAPADKMLEAMYWPELIIAGEGAPTYHGIESFRQPFAETMSALGSNCGFANDSPVISTSDLAAVFSEFVCSYEDAEDLKIRILYVWQKRNGEWKVIRENYSVGEM